MGDRTTTARSASLCRLARSWLRCRLCHIQLGQAGVGAGCEFGEGRCLAGVAETLLPRINRHQNIVNVFKTDNASVVLAIHSLCGIEQR
jgi:hypothetical protein